MTYQKRALVPGVKQSGISAVKTMGKVILGMTAKKAVTAALIVLLAGALITAGVIFLPKMLNPADPTNTPGVSGTETPGTTTPDNPPGATDTTPSNTDEPGNTMDAPKDPVVLLPDPENINVGYLERLNRGLTIGVLGGGAAVDDMIDETYEKYGKYLNENITKICVKLGLYEIVSITDDASSITPEALEKVNDFLIDNGEEPLGTTDPKQRVAALWLAASLYYDPDFPNPLSDEENYAEWRFDIGQAFAIAKYSDPEHAEWRKDSLVPDRDIVEDYCWLYASGYAQLFNLISGYENFY